MFNGKKEAELNIAIDARESLKKKMIAAGSHQMVEVTAPELAIVMSEGLDELIREVEQHRSIRSELKQHKAIKKAEDEYVASATMDNRDYGSVVTNEVTFEEVVKPLMKWLAENHCPHKHVVVSATSAELFGGLKSFNTVEFLKD